jgi:hypothetical protein
MNNRYSNLNLTQLDAKALEVDTKQGLWWARLPKATNQTEYDLCWERISQYHELYREVYRAREALQKI